MNFPDQLFGTTWIVGSLVLFLPIVVWCVWTAPWRRLADSAQLNVWLGTIVILMLMWSMKASVRPGMNMHLLGATMFTLMFGRQLAIIGLSVVLAAVTYNSMDSGNIGWSAYALNALAMIVVPVSVAWAILRAVERWLPAHFFIYVFVATFFGAALNTVVTGLAATSLLAVAGVYSSDILFGDFFLSYFLLAFAEAWLTGAAITLMIVYYPHWVATFDDRRYLWKKMNGE
jgi:uncharacterized membrane protein